MLGAYIQLGFEHILDPKGYDHILFVVALCAIYMLRDWKKVLILVTAFTVGHSLTLALSSLKILNISSSLVETLIPVTIVLTCIFNIFKAWNLQDTSSNIPEKDILDSPITQVEELEEGVMGNYLLALGFGLIHGLGFSNFFKAMMDKDESIVLPLLNFNIGVELGQIIIVIATLILGYIMVQLFKVKRRIYTIGLSSLIMVWAVYLMF